MAATTLPKGAVRVRLPYSEVCIHMQLAGQERWVVPCWRRSDLLQRPILMAQILNEDGSNFSFPVCAGEAGLDEHGQPFPSSAAPPPLP